MKGRFGMVNFEIMNRTDIPANAKTIYACIACFADKNRECYPSKPTLVKMTGLANATFDKHMKILIEKKIVTVARMKKGNLNAGNRYKLNDIESCDETE